MIGIFDSGLGGLTVAKEIMKILPEYQILYFGDTARLPYGNKSRETIIKYVIEDTEFLLKKGAKIIIAACHTASALAIDELKKKFKIPIFEMVTPSAEKALEVSKKKRIGVIGTRATIESSIYKKLLDQKAFVFTQSCPLLVPLIEEDWIKKPEMKMILKKYLAPLKVNNIDTLILACTHYPIIKDLIQIKIGRRVALVDPAQEVALEVKKFLEENPEIEKSDDEVVVLRRAEPDEGSQFYVSDLTPHFQELARKWLGRKVRLRELPL